MATREQLMSALRNADKAGDSAAAKRLANMLSSGDYPKEQPQEQAQPQEEQGFLGNVADKISSRGEQFGKDMAGVGEDLLTVNPLQTLAAGQRGIRRIGGFAAGAGADIIGEGIASIADAVTPEFIQEGAKDALSYVGDTAIGKGIGGAAKSVAEIYAGFKNKNPELAQDIADTANMATMALPVKLKVPSISKGKELASKVLDTSKQKVFNEAVPDIKQLKQAAGEIYARLDNSNSRVAGNRLDSLGTNTKEKLVKAGYDRDLYPQLKTIISRLDETSGKNLSLGELQNLRKLTDAPLGSLNKSEARLGGIARDSIDDFIESLSPKDFIGTPSKNIGSDLKDARQLWRRAKKLEVVEEAMTKANLQASGFENGIRTQFRSILNNPRKRKGFTKDELLSMENVVKGGKLENVTRALGKFGFSEGQASSMLLGSLGLAGGFAAGGAGGAALVPVMGQISKKLAQKLTRNNAKSVEQIIAAGKEGDDIVKAYMKLTPKKERNLKDLTELLLRPDVSLKKLQANLPKSKGSQGTMVANAAYLAALAQRSKEEK